MRRLGVGSICLAVVLSLVAGAAVSRAGEGRTMQLGHCDATTADNGYQILATQFNDNLKEASGGKLGVEIFGDSILGGERDLMEGLNLGTIDMAIVSNMYVSNFVDDFKVFDVPYIFANYDEAVATLADAELLAPMTAQLLSDNNTVFLASGTIGFRHVINTKKPILTVSDLKGMKLRVPETPALVKAFQAFGANPTTTAWSEAFTAVQQKTVDGLEVTTSAIYTGRFWEICKFMSLTRHFYQPLHIMINANLWKSLSDEERGWITAAAAKAGANQPKRIEQLEQGLLDKMNAGGCAVNQVKDLEEFRAACAPVYEYIKGIVGAELVGKVQARVKKAAGK